MRYVHPVIDLIRLCMLYLRLLFKNPTLSLINLSGLALGISSCIFISLFVSDELSYDSSHQNLDRIYRVTTKIVSEASVDHVNISSAPFVLDLKQNFPGVDQAVRFMSMTKESTVKQGDLLVREKNVFGADPTVFEVFTYPMLKGNPKLALAGPNRVVLTQSMATKYFGVEDPMGKVLAIGQKDHVVTGVIADVPLNSDLIFSMLTSLDTTGINDDWFDFGHLSYVLINKESLADKDYVKNLESKFNKVVDDKINRPLRDNKQNTVVTVHFQPLKGMHFDPPLLYDTPKGNIQYTYIFSCVAALILLIGCLNYINFSIIQSIERSKEVGIRKVVGAAWHQLVVRYIGESFFFTLMSLLVGLGIVLVLMPLFNSVTGRSFGISHLFSNDVVIAIVAILLVVGILAGSYPAFYTSSIKPVEALKGKVSTPKGQIVRKFSIAAQFFISIGLIICTVIVYIQMNFIRKYDLGFDKDHTISIPVPGDTTLNHKVSSLKSSLLQNSKVKIVSICGLGAVPGDPPERGTVTLKTDGKEGVRMVNYVLADEAYIPALGIQMLQGRNFDGLNDLNNYIIVNESVVRLMGWKNPLEQEIHWNGEYRKVIGVIRNFHYASLYNQVDPQLIVYHHKRINNLIVSINGNPTAETMKELQRSWEAVFPDEPFEYKFLDETVQLQYEREQKAMTVFTYFSALTIMISSLGLFGLSSLTVYQRKREIGIRRIVGADVTSIVSLFSREYIILISCALVAVSPLTWMLMDKWLQTFPFRQPITISIFLITGVVVISISVITIMLSIIKIAAAKAVTLIRES